MQKQQQGQTIQNKLLFHTAKNAKKQKNQEVETKSTKIIHIQGT